jgi:hypothetical protein
LERINERPLVDLVKKQQSVRQLWPKYDKRVANLRTLGETVTLVDDSRPGVWVFHVKSWSHSQGDKKAPDHYVIKILFRRIRNIIPEIIAKKSTWTSDGSKVDLRRFGAELMTEADITFNCSCPAQKFWGMDYLNTQGKDRYGEPERRPPNEKNPNGYGYFCKHMGMVFSQIPMYSVTLGKDAARWFKKTFEASVANVRGAELHNPEDEEQIAKQSQEKGERPMAKATANKNVAKDINARKIPQIGKSGKLEKVKDEIPQEEPRSELAKEIDARAIPQREPEEEAPVKKVASPAGRAAGRTVGVAGRKVGSVAKDINAREIPQEENGKIKKVKSSMPIYNTGISTPQGIGVVRGTPRAE